MPDHYDVDIAVKLPINFQINSANPIDSDILFDHSGTNFAYVNVKMGRQFINLPQRDNWSINKTAYGWLDDSNYLLPGSFAKWFQKVLLHGLKALANVDSNISKGFYLDIDKILYKVNLSTKFYRFKLIVEAMTGNEFICDFHILPTLLFLESRWPISRQYRPIPDTCRKIYWRLLPKDDNVPSRRTGITLFRSWRISLSEQEYELYCTESLRRVSRLVSYLFIL